MINCAAAAAIVARLNNFEYANFELDSRREVALGKVVRHCY